MHTLADRVASIDFVCFAIGKTLNCKIMLEYDIPHESHSKAGLASCKNNLPMNFDSILNQRCLPFALTRWMLGEINFEWIDWLTSSN